jgi:hypothetical protein
MAAKTKPFKNEEEVQQSSDEHIDQDFPGFPHLPSTNKTIKPKTDTDKKVAGTLKNKKTNKTYGR